MSNAVLTFFGSAALAFLLTPLAAKLSRKLKVYDRPDARRLHLRSTPRLGGVAMFLAFLAVLIVIPVADETKFVVAVAGIVFFGLGFVDDLFGLSPKVKLFVQILGAALAVAAGLTVGHAFSTPLGGSFEIPQIGLYALIPPLLTVFWIVLIVNTVNVLDGIDGVASGVVGIAALTVLALSIKLGQPAGSVLLAAAVSGVAFGFLPRNFAPAKIFMGDSGSYFLGFSLAVISIISGAKIATAVLVLGLPLLDLAYTVWRRLRSGVPIFQADKEHLHHRLLAAGLSVKQTAWLFYFFSAAFGVIAVFSETQVKMAAIAALFLLMTLLLLFTFLRTSKGTSRGSDE